MLNSTTKDGFQNILYIFAGLIITSFTLALQPIFFKGSTQNLKDFL